MRVYNERLDLHRSIPRERRSIHEPSAPHLCIEVAGVLLAHTAAAIVPDPDRMPGGACNLSPAVVEIRANNVLICFCGHLTSLDYDGDADGGVSLSYLVVIGFGLSTGAPECTDYFNDGTASSASARAGVDAVGINEARTCDKRN
jgi:hypothetical protein